MRAWILVLGIAWTLLTVGCPQDGEVCGQDAVTAECSTDLGRGGCLAEGGCWGTWGLAPSPSCNCPTTDAGDPCASPDDCQGDCLAPLADEDCPEEGTCSDMERVFGCHCFIGMGGGEGMCVD